MATHQVLSCADVISLICGQCDKPTLTSLARTRRDISEIALNDIWHSIPDIGLLICCMPEDLWEEQKNPVKGTALTFRRSILSTDWNRFEINAMRVRRLGFMTSPFVGHALGMDVYAALACASVGRTPLLPRLVSLRWAPQTDVEYPFISLFASPSIQTLSLDVTGKSDPGCIKVRLSLLPQLCPNISHLTLRNKYGLSRPAPQEIESALSAIRQWSTLRCLEMTGLPDVSMLCVSKFPNLRELTITNPHETKEERLPMRVKGFTKLEHLDIGFSTVDYSIQLISCMSGTPLRTLRLEFGRDPEESQLSELFMAMRRCIAHDSLRHIRISYDGSRTELMEEDRSITFGDLSPLLVFAYLSEVSIAVNYEFHISNADLKTMALRWPHLQTLALTSLRPSEYWPRITINDIASLVGHFPTLENLTIAFDASEVCLSANNPGVPNKKIHTLGVLSSPIDEPGKVAAFLSDVVPNLRFIDIFQCEDEDVGGDFEELERKWKEVERNVAVFSLVRMQESMRHLR